MFGALPQGAYGAVQSRGIFGSQPAAPQQPQQKAYLDTTMGKIGVLGDLLLRASGRGGNPLHQYRLEQEQQQSALQAQQQQNEALLRRQELARQGQLANQKALIDYRAQNPAPTALSRDISTLSDLGYSQQEAIDRLRPEQIQVVPLPGGRTYVGPNSGISSAFGRAPTRPVGRLTPVEPTTQNTPAPQLNANGLPTSLTREQYTATVQTMGQAETDAWMRRNNIRVTN